MGSSRIDLTLCLILGEAEAALLFDYANSNRQSIPDAVRSLVLESLTLPGVPVNTIEYGDSNEPPFDADPQKISPPSADGSDPALRRGTTTTTTTTADDDADESMRGEVSPRSPLP